MVNRILPRGIGEIYNIFNFKKVPKLASFRVKLVNFLSEKGRSRFLLRSLHFGSNRLSKKKSTKSGGKISSGYSSIKDRLRSCVAFLIKEEGSALFFHQKFSPNYFRRVFYIYN